MSWRGDPGELKGKERTCERKTIAHGAGGFLGSRLTQLSSGQKSRAPRTAEYRRSTIGANEEVLGGSGKLFHFPGVARAKELAEVAAAALGDNVFDLLVHHVFVAWHLAPRTEDPDGRWEVGRCSMCESWKAYAGRGWCAS